MRSPFVPLTRCRLTLPVAPALLMALLVLCSGCATVETAQTADAFQRLQAASGVEESARHPEGSALSRQQARVLLGQLSSTRITQRNLAPRRALCWLLDEALLGGERVEYVELRRRARHFDPLVLVRPDGYLVAVPSGAPLQRLGQVKHEQGTWKVGRLVVGEFYFSRAGVLYPVTAALRRAQTPPWAELGLGRDPLNAALDGTQDAVGEMVLALGHSVLHPIRSLEDLAQLPQTVARLIATSPEYFAHYAGLSLEEQIREAARLSTHLMMLVGGGEAALGSMGGGLGAELPLFSLSAEGELVLSEALAGATVTTLGVEAGTLSVVAMSARGGPGRGGGISGSAGKGTTNQGPGRWVYRTPTTESEEALEYQEQITGQPASRVYMIGDLEFDGFGNKGLEEAKGPGYKQFLNKDGTLKPWFEVGKGFQGLLVQAEKQSKLASKLKLPLTWYVAEEEFANFLRTLFRDEGWGNITVVHEPPVL